MRETKEQTVLKLDELLLFKEGNFNFSFFPNSYNRLCEIGVDFPSEKFNMFYEYS